jgi:hypothetical protein
MFLLITVAWEEKKNVSLVSPGKTLQSQLVLLKICRFGLITKYSNNVGRSVLRKRSVTRGSFAHFLRTLNVMHRQRILKPREMHSADISYYTL